MSINEFADVLGNIKGIKQVEVGKNGMITFHATMRALSIVCWGARQSRAGCILANTHCPHRTPYFICHVATAGQLLDRMADELRRTAAEMEITRLPNPPSCGAA